jgi:AmpD protein
MKKNASFQDGWLEGCHPIISNHYHLPPQLDTGKTDKDLLVLHCISLPAGVYDNFMVERLFTNDLRFDDKDILQKILSSSGRVSAHFFIKRSGERIQFVAVQYCAWHAGVSEYFGRKNCNDFSIGIELQGKIGEGFTEHQYRSLYNVVLALKRKFPQIQSIDAECKILGNVVAHSQIAPSRKQDPGDGFDWNYFRSLFEEQD